jgi:uncharacterized protein
VNDRAADPSRTALPLFPLKAVLFPGMWLRLKVFEARYLDLMGRCLRESTPFGVVCLRQGEAVERPRGATAATVRFESVGVMATLREVDAEQAGLLHVACEGSQRFEIDTAATQATDGLWQADVRLLPDDPVLAPDAELIPAVRALATAIGTLERQGAQPFTKPYHFDHAGWSANRWCELLPIPLAAKQRLMALPDPMLRLRLVSDYLRGKGVVS